MKVILENQLGEEVPFIRFAVSRREKKIWYDHHLVVDGQKTPVVASVECGFAGCRLEGENLVYTTNGHSIKTESYEASNEPVKRTVRRLK